MAGGHSGWQVTGQVTDQAVNTQAGQTVVGVQVYFITGAGNEGSVFVPNNVYNHATVTKMIHQQATLIDEVGRLVAGPTLVA